jgi:hypothetical protein
MVLVQPLHYYFKKPEDAKYKLIVIRRNLHRSNNPLFAKSGWSTRCQVLSMLNLKRVSVVRNDYIIENIYSFCSF